MQCCVDFRDSFYAYTLLRFSAGRTGTFFFTLNEHTRGDTIVIPPIFFLRNYNYNYNKMYACDGYMIYKVEIIFPQSPQYQHTFPPLLETLYAGRQHLFAGVSQLFTYTVVLLLS